jgi:hypothetical protein
MIELGLALENKPVTHPFWLSLILDMKNNSLIFHHSKKFVKMNVVLGTCQKK